MIKKILITGLLSLSIINFTSGFTLKAGGTSDDRAIATVQHSNGDISVGGIFQGTANLFGGTSFVSSGSTDGFLVRFSSTGTLLRRIKLGGTGAETVSRISATPDNGTIIIGTYSANFTTQSQTLTNSGGTDVYMAKFSSDGILERIKKAGGIGTDSINDISTDNTGNSFVAGNSSNTGVNFGLSFTGNNGTDSWFMKINNSGDGTTLRRVGAAGTENGKAITTDIFGNIYVAGEYSNSQTIFGTPLTVSGNTDIFVSKLDANFSGLRTRKAGGTAADIVTSLRVDSDQNIIIGGTTQSANANFFGTTISTSGSSDIWISKLSPNGTGIRTRKAGGSSAETLGDIATSGTDILAIGTYTNNTGNYFGTILANSGGTDIVFAGLNSGGTAFEVRKAGGTQADQGLSIINTSTNQPFAVGFYGNATTTIFGTSLTTSGSNDIFVSHIDYVPATGTILYSPATATSGNVIATITGLNESILVTNNSGSLSRTFTGNGTFAFNTIDSGGNATVFTATVSRIDKTAPTGFVSYTPSSLTNTDVIATLTGLSETGITVTNNGGLLDRTFTTNGSFTFEFQDSAGNTGSAIADVNRIDTDAPTATISYSPSSLTNTDVIATLTGFSETGVTITNNAGLSGFTFTGNNTFTFQFQDSAGNTGQTTATVTRIDKTPPIATIEYTPNTLTNTNVVSKLTGFSEPITITNNGASDTYIFSSNNTFTFEFQDSAGNTGSTTANVYRIDTDAPTATISYSPSSLTNTDVIATLTGFSETGVTITNNAGLSEFTFTGNNTFTFQFQDSAGNTGQTTATVTRIDKTPPIATIEYSTNTLTSGDVIATITGSSEPIIITNNAGLSGYIFTGNGEFIFEFTDSVGNIGYATGLVSRIDKTKPTATVQYSPSTPTNGNVIVLLQSYSETITITNNSGDNFIILTGNSGFSFEFTDIVGNTGTVTGLVDRIDKITPMGTILYSTTSLTTLPVIVTLTGLSETSITITNNSGNNTFTFTTNGSFIFQIQDSAGNTNQIAATVSNINPTTPTQGGGSNGGGSSSSSLINKDICIDGDFSDSYYDGKCNTTISISTKENIENTNIKKEPLIEFNSATIKPNNELDFTKEYCSISSKLLFAQNSATKNNLQDYSNYLNKLSNIFANITCKSQKTTLNKITNYINKMIKKQTLINKILLQDIKKINIFLLTK